MTDRAGGAGRVPSDHSSLLIEQAHKALLERLRDGRLTSGGFLSMPMLVKQLELPIAAVRDAVKRCEACGLLTVLPKRGVAVMDAGPEMTRECLELRAMFDCEGARRLITQGGSIPLDQLRSAHESLRDAARDRLTPEMPKRAIEVDLSLHDALAAGIGGGLAGRLYAENRDRIAVIQNTRPFLPDRIVPAMDEHLAIIAAIEARDTGAATAAIREHLSGTLRWWGIGV
ncbi:GntR family transcriptional regulator [Roseovarius sp. CAU 1744]|uniref:GntR family transcriptional regulator n=1 Tax=Roseovarius sp. CAU 1744 TaxID=3140368 RepID=UPI00325B9440